MPHGSTLTGGPPIPVLPARCSSRFWAASMATCWRRVDWSCGSTRLPAHSRSGRTARTSCRSVHATTVRSCGERLGCSPSPNASALVSRAATGTGRTPRGALADQLAEPGAAADIAVALDAFRGRPGDLASWSELDALIARQHWRASKFNLDRDAINYRRFFTISDLAGLRVEDDDVFDATHGLLFQMLREGLIDGVRIDHIDGLRDPKAYSLRLREKAGRPFYLLVEKILAKDERLPADWGAEGTTGYEVTNLLIGLVVNPDTTDALTTLYRDFTGREADPESVVRAAKIEVLTGAMAAEVEGIAARLHALARRDPRTRDLGRLGLKDRAGRGDRELRRLPDLRRRGRDRTRRPCPDSGGGRTREGGGSRARSGHLRSCRNRPRGGPQGRRHGRARLRDAGAAGHRADHGQGPRGRGALPLQPPDRAQRSRQ